MLKFTAKLAKIFQIMIIFVQQNVIRPKKPKI